MSATKEKMGAGIFSGSGRPPRVAASVPPNFLLVLRDA
jgi:hypothetical protein